jgi:hypothetical protein
MVGRFYARILRSIARIESTAERSDVRIYCGGDMVRRIFNNPAIQVAHILYGKHLYVPSQLRELTVVVA